MTTGARDMYDFRVISVNAVLDRLDLLYENTP
jgi:hypothetical protein